ncbi:hypothetical protein DOTSEDRAFT_134205 [Dothistroma septosporum NZE10]|uniref:DOPA-like domain-containing protein n=1 Tax=Dothistroma septosporum (strain NZE10 / CBS 128990) TaxID=675120 RepID=N1PJG5_DOTSN|nr:hypothetical protein DOTSEDRAFT_134205 [Dothistroma septosporum NZE10]
MADPTLYEYPDPLEGYDNLEPLSEDRNEDGKSLQNPSSTKLSKAYDEFVDPLDKTSRGGFDIHIYFLQTNERETSFARKLHERIRREFPELRIYQFHDKPIGPHPVGMFEVNVFSPHQFGAFVSWLVINRGPLSALIHPNTGSHERDHTQRVTWMGQPYPLQTGILRWLDERDRKESEGRENEVANGDGVAKG